MDESMKLLTMSEADLDLMIAKFLLEGELRMKPFSENERRFIAQQWFKKNLKKFQSAICSNLIVQGILKKENKTQMELAAAVMDALLAIGGWGNIPVTVLSARLINYGLEKLCHESEM
jgi:hypothetical protein